MKIVLRVVVLAALAALGVWLWTVLFPSPEKIIRRQLNEVAKHASFTANESNFARMASAQALPAYFATNAEVSINTQAGNRHNFVGRDQIREAALASRTEAGSLSVKFLDVEVTVASDKQSATADLTVDVNISGQQNAIVQEVKITLIKTGGEWLITSVETVRTLS